MAADHVKRWDEVLNYDTAIDEANCHKTDNEFESDGKDRALTAMPLAKTESSAICLLLAMSLL